MSAIPRVLFLNSCVHGGGAGNSLAAYLREEGASIEAHVVLPKPGILAERIRDHARLWYVPAFVERIERAPYRFLRGIRSRTAHIVANFWSILVALRHVVGIVRRVKPDVIYCNHMLAEVVGVAAGALTRTSVVIHARNIHVTRFGRWIYRVFAARGVVKAVLANSAWTSLMYRDLCPSKLRVIHNFIDHETFRRDRVAPALRTEFGIPGGAVVFGYLGRFVPWKGVDLLLRAFEPVFRAFPNAYLCILGETDSGMHLDYREAYARLAEDLGISSRTVFVPFHADVRPILADFDVLVLPSVQPEPFGRVLIEAMCFGIPSIVAGHGGALEIVRHGRNGLWFEPRNAEDLARKMSLLARHRSLRTRMGERALHESLPAFRADRRAGSITEVLRSVVRCGSPADSADLYPPEVRSRVQRFAESPAAFADRRRSVRRRIPDQL
jgi:glycosyltransferase involved in cell wall biosynthesis